MNPAHKKQTGFFKKLMAGTALSFALTGLFNPAVVTQPAFAHNDNAQQAAAADEMVYLDQYRAPDFTTPQASVTFDIREGETFVHSKIKIRRNGDHGRKLVLDGGNNLRLISISVDGKTLNAAEGDFRIDKKSLTLHKMPAADEFDLETTVRIEPEKNTQLDGLYRSGGIWVTQCEPQGFRRITYFIDRPDNLTVFTVKIITDKEAAPTQISNGNMIGQGEMPDGRHYTEWHDPFPKSSYVFAIIAGQLDHIEKEFVTMSGRKVKLRVFSKAKDLDKLQYAMQSLENFLRWDEEVNGREYDLDKYDMIVIDDFNAGAMENKSAVTFNANAILITPETQTDSQHRRVETVVSHEGCHNWRGNRVPPRNWFQLSLKEGYANFCDQSFSEYMNPKDVMRIQHVMVLKAVQFPEDAGPLAHPVRPDRYEQIRNFYTKTIYAKGSENISMMEALLGPEKFREAQNLYFARQDGVPSTVEDLVRAMEDVSGRDMKQFMLWYTQAGTPVVKARWAHDAKTGKFTLTLGQTVPPTPNQPVKKPMLIPVRFGIVGPDGKDVVLDADSGKTETVLELTQPEQSFVFENVPAGSVPSILRHFSAPVKLDAPYTDNDLHHLMIHDSDGFNQWEAGSTFMRGKMLEQLDRYEQGHPVVVPASVIDAYRGILGRKDMNKELKDLTLDLPAEDIMLGDRKNIDPHAVEAVYEAFKNQIAAALKPEFTALYNENSDHTKPYATDTDSVGERALRHTALYFLARSGGSGKEMALKESKKLYETANNMTDRKNALRVTVRHADKAAADAMLSDFYKRFENNDLVIDEWFKLQAAQPRKDIRETVERLTRHPAFLKRAGNPNLIRALYTPFINNVEGFHAKDGSGYRMIADLVLKLDKLNPMLASRMVAPFAKYKRYTPEISALMEKEIRRMAETPDLSSDVKDKIRRTLDSGKKTKAERVAAYQPD